MTEKKEEYSTLYKLAIITYFCWCIVYLFPLFVRDYILLVIINFTWIILCAISHILLIVVIIIESRKEKEKKRRES